MNMDADEARMLIGQAPPLGTIEIGGIVHEITSITHRFPESVSGVVEIKDVGDQLLVELPESTITVKRVKLYEDNLVAALLSGPDRAPRGSGCGREALDHRRGPRPRRCGGDRS